MNQVATCSKAGTFSVSALTLGTPIDWGEGHFVILPVFLIELRTPVWLSNISAKDGVKISSPMVTHQKQATGN